MNLILKSLNISKQNSAYSLYFIIFLMLLNSIFELLSIVLIIPIIGLVLDSNFSLNHPNIFYILENLSNYFLAFIEIEKEKKIIYITLVIFLVVMILRFIFAIFFTWIVGKFKYELNVNLSRKVFNNYLNKPYSYFLNRNSANLIRNSTNEVSLFSSLVEQILTMLTDLILVSTLFIFLLIYDFKSTISIFALISFVAVIFLSFTKKKIIKYGIDRQIFNGKAFQYAKESFGGIKEIIILNRKSHFSKKFINTINILSNLIWKRKVLQTLPKFIFELFIIFTFVLYFIISLYYDKPNEKIIEALSVYLLSSIRAIPGINRVVVGFQNLKFNKPVVELFKKDLNFENYRGDTTLNQNKIKDIHFKNKIEIKNISFSYDPNKNNVLENLNLQINKGDFIGFKGKSGAGKSTLIDLIVGILKPQSGEIIVDGVNINDCKENWRDKIGYVPQNVFLTDDTIKKNICLGLKEEDIDPINLSRAVELSELNDFINKLPQGIDSKIGENGLQISGGQRQRIGIARALYLNPELIILDESLNAVDLETENKIIKSIKKVRGVKTIILVSHRQSTLDNCNTIYQLENKEISNFNVKK